MKRGAAGAFGTGMELFRAVFDHGLDGTVVTPKGVYDPDTPTWVKIKNPTNSQRMGRQERFEQMRSMPRAEVERRRASVILVDKAGGR